MRKLVIFLLFALFIVSSSQLLGLFFPIYYVFDELLSLILLGIFFILVQQNEISVNKGYIALLYILGVVFVINFIYGFYSIVPFLFKLSYYLKSLLPFIFVPFLVKYSFKSKQYKILISLIAVVAILGLYEFIMIQFVDTFYFGHNIPLKFRNDIYRSSSITGHPISFGLLMFFGLLFTVITKPQNSKLLNYLFFIAILLSGSRIPLLLTVLLIVFNYRNTRVFIKKGLFITLKKIYLIFIPIFIIVYLIVLPKYLERNNESTTIRVTSIVNGIKTFSNPINLIIGNGIGSYGMHWSVSAKSPIYNDVNYPNTYLDLLLTSNKSSGMESFLFMLLIEFGLVGTILFFMIIFHQYDSKISTTKLFLITVMLLYATMYPLYTLPSVFIINMIFPYFENPDTFN